MKIGLFVPCYIDALFPEVAIATLELLEGLGVEVGYPADQTCCGQPMANSGCRQEAAVTEAHFATCFGTYDTVVGPSGRCVYHVRRHLDAIRQTPEVTKVRGAVRELVEFLHDDLKVADFPHTSFPHKVGLFNSCTAIRGLGHARSSERAHEPDYSKTRDILSKIPGLRLVERERIDECCGFGGSFCVTDQAVAAKMSEDLVHDFHRQGAEYLTSADMSCLLHIKGAIDRLGLPLKVIHIAQILNGAPG